MAVAVSARESVTARFCAGGASCFASSAGGLETAASSLGPLLALASFFDARPWAVGAAAVLSTGCRRLRLIGVGARGS